jgi:hypothetical protein
MMIMNGRDYTSDQPEEKNPKQVLIDWVTGVRSAAYRAKNVLHSGRKDAVDLASDEIASITGMCEAMMVVLENSD